MRPFTNRSTTRTRGLRWLALVVIFTVLAAPVAAAPTRDLGATEPVRLLQSDATGATVEFALSASAALKPGETAQALGSMAGCQRIEAAGLAQTSEVGQPQLPMKAVLLGAPADAELLLTMTRGQTRTLAQGVRICAASQPTDDSASANSLLSSAASPALDAAIYDRDAFYPDQPVRLVDMGFMRSQRVVRLEFYPFQVNPVTGEVRETARLSAHVAFVGGTAGAAVSEPADWEQSFGELLLNAATARSFRATAGADPAATSAAWTPPQPGYRIAVKEEGMYHLTRAWLAAAGLPVDSLNPRTFRLFNNKAEVAIRVTGEEDTRFDAGDEVLFYGRGVDTRYTDTNIYWLTYGGAQGLRMASRASISGGAAVASYLTSIKKEDNTTYDSNLPMLPGYDHWFGQQIQAVGAGKTGAVSVSLATPQLTQGTASISVSVGAVTTGSHRVRLYVNPNLNPSSVFDGTWDGATVFQATTTVPHTQLNASGNNTIKVEIVNEFAGRAADIVRLDWVKLTYPRGLVADGDKLLFGGDATGPRRYSVAGFSTRSVDLYDVTNGGQVVLITGATVGPTTSRVYLPLLMKFAKGGGAIAASSQAAAPASAMPAAGEALQFGDNMPTPRRYAAWDRGQFLTPTGIVLDQASTLQATNQGADYIIITHADFAAAVQPLATLRTNLGLRVRVVDVQDIYDEFGGGLMSAEAIRDFVAFAYSNWAKPAPSYILLVGDGTYDFRNYTSAVKTYVPPYLELVDPDAGETATDNRFVAVTTDNQGNFDILPDLHVGRLPANTAAEATIMVNKILAYEAQTVRPWTKQVLFVADDLEGGGGDFYAYSNGIADGTTLVNGVEVKILPADYTPNKVYLGQTCDLGNPSQSAECRAQIINQINSGSLMVSYIGHGVKTYWAAERLYDANSLASLNNAGRLPVMLPMTCNEGYFIDPAEASLSEQSVRMDGRGVIASWSPTGFGLAPGHDYLQRGLFLGVFHDSKPLGSAATAAKLYLVANAAPGAFLDLIDTFLLLGDPALRVK